MELSRADLRELAVESPVGRGSYAAMQLALALRTRDPFRRGGALLRAWRSADYGLFASRASAFLQRHLTPGGQLVALRDNPILQSYVDTPEARRVRTEFAGYSLNDRVRMRLPRPAESETRQGALMVLKRHDPATGEKGALLIKYSEAIEQLPALFAVERLIERYAIVLEPSWWGYQDVALFNLAGADADVIVQAQARDDFAFLRKHGYGLTPVPIGAGDWIDPEFFVPSRESRQFDLVMVSSWNPFKRHRDLFHALREARDRHGRVLRAALVGYPNGWTAEVIRQGLAEHGLEDQSEVFDAIPQARVAEIVSRSRAYVLLSRREGANKAMYEAMFCDTPVIAPVEHKGINHDHLNPQTGVAFARGNLTDALISVVDASDSFAPRKWAEANTGYENASRILNNVLEQVAISRGGPWLHAIAAKKNQPNLTYGSEADRIALEGEYEGLAEFLRPV